MKKTKEIIFRRLHLKAFDPLPLAIPGLDQVHEAKLLRIEFTCTLNFTEHVSTVLKLCS